MEIVALVTVSLSMVRCPLRGSAARHLPAARLPEQCSRDYCIPTENHQKEKCVCGQDQVPRHNSSSSSPSSSSSSSSNSSWPSDSFSLARPFEPTEPTFLLRVSEVDYLHGKSLKGIRSA